jgi:hypothetical protein
VALDLEWWRGAWTLACSRSQARLARRRRHSLGASLPELPPGVTSGPDPLLVWWGRPDAAGVVGEARRRRWIEGGCEHGEATAAAAYACGRVKDSGFF